MKNNNKLLLFLSISLISFFASIIFTFPLVLKLNTHYTDTNDLPLNGYAMLSRLSPLTQFFPFSYSGTSLDLSLSPSFIFFPVFFITRNIVLSTNIFILFTLTVNFLSVFYVLNFFVKNIKAGLIGALIYTYNPFVFSRFPQHLLLLQQYFIPLVFLFTYKLFKKPDLKNSFLFALYVLLNSLISVYYQIFTFFIVFLTSLPFLLNNIVRKNGRYFSGLFKTSLIIVPFLLVILYSDLSYLQFSKMEGIKRTVSDSTFFSARFTDFLSSTPDSFLYGGLIRQLEEARQPKEYDGTFNYAEHTLFLNIAPFCLFLTGLYMFVKTNRNSQNRLFLTGLIIVIIFSFTMMWGPFFNLGGTPFTALKLPYYFMYKMLPFFQGIRVPTRFEIVFYFPFVVFGAYGAKYIFSRFAAKRNLIFIGILALLFIENINLKTYSETSAIHEKIFAYSQKNPEIIRLLSAKKTVHFPSFIPIPNRFYDEVRYLTWSVYTKELLLNSHSYLPPDWINFLNIINNDLSEETLQKMRAMKVDYVIIHKDLYKTDLPSIYEKYFLNNDKEFSRNQIFQDDNTLILDLSKYNFNIRLCSLVEDFDKKIQTPPYVVSGQPIVVQLSLENKSDCYLFPEKDKRYLKSEIALNNSKGKTVFFKIPFLVGPFEKVVMEETVNSSHGINRLQVIIQGLNIDYMNNIYSYRN